MNYLPPSTLITIGIVIAALGIATIFMATLPFGLMVTSARAYTASLGIRRHYASLPRCPKCALLVSSQHTYCPNCGVPIPFGEPAPFSDDNP